MSALARWASTYLIAESGALQVDPEETEVALAIYAHTFDVQMAGARGIVKLFPNGHLQRDWGRYD